MSYASELGRVTGGLTKQAALWDKLLRAGKLSFDDFARMLKRTGMTKHLDHAQFSGQAPWEPMAVGGDNAMKATEMFKLLSGKPGRRVKPSWKNMKWNQRVVPLGAESRIEIPDELADNLLYAIRRQLSRPANQQVVHGFPKTYPDIYWKHMIPGYVRKH
jgi:hypothetical protein